jgi:SNF2 family DNA or RNA helicase
LLVRGFETSQRRRLLCDDMGLGKTIQVIGLILGSPPPGVAYAAPETLPADTPMKAEPYVQFACGGIMMGD